MIGIKLDDLKPGMVLAGNVVDGNGRRLMKSGIELTRKNIRILKAWGILEVDVVMDDETCGQSSASEKTAGKNECFNDADVQKRAENILSRRFKHNDHSHEAVQELYKLCIQRKTKQLSKEKEVFPEDSYDYTASPAIAHPKITDIQLEEIKEETFESTISKILKNINSLPTLPNIYLELTKIINDPWSSAREIADVISKDTSLSAQILKVANSAFYGLRTKVETIAEAVINLGIREIGALSMGLTYIKYFKNIPENVIDMNLFWEHGIACAIAARTIGGYAGVENIERLFVGGILHDIGRLLLFINFPDKAAAALQKARREDQFLYHSEMDILGVHHSEIGGMLLNHWGLPESIENMVAFHHAPEKSQFPKEPAVVELADWIVNALCIGTSGEQYVPELKEETWRIAGISKNVLATIIKQIDRQMIDVFRFFQDG